MGKRKRRGTSTKMLRTGAVVSSYKRRILKMIEEKDPRLARSFNVEVALQGKAVTWFVFPERDKLPPRNGEPEPYHLLPVIEYLAHLQEAVYRTNEKLKTRVKVVFPGNGLNPNLPTLYIILPHPYYRKKREGVEGNVQVKPGRRVTVSLPVWNGEDRRLIRAFREVLQESGHHVMNSFYESIGSIYMHRHYYGGREDPVVRSLHVEMKREAEHLQTELDAVRLDRENNGEVHIIEVKAANTLRVPGGWKEVIARKARAQEFVIRAFEGAGIRTRVHFVFAGPETRVKNVVKRAENVLKRYDTYRGRTVLHGVGVGKRIVPLVIKEL